MKLIFFLILYCFVCSEAVNGYSYNSRAIFNEAVNEAKSGNLDFAFMHYYSILNNDPDSVYRDQVLFALGEYYFLAQTYSQAQNYLEQYVRLTQDENGKLFARIYLYKIAEQEKNIPIMEQVESDILNQKSHVFLFRDQKVYKFRSPLWRNYQAVFSVTDIKFYSEGELIAKISF